MKRTYTYCNMNQPQKQRWEFKAQREENIGQTILKTNFQQAMPLLEGSKVQGKIKSTRKQEQNMLSFLKPIEKKEKIHHKHMKKKQEKDNNNPSSP